MARLLAFSGSSRSGSFNTRLVQAAASLATAQGAEVEMLDLRSLELPLYDADLEAAEGLPAGVVALKEKMGAAGGFLIGCPEYNGSITPALKNAIDWASRRAEGEAPLAAFDGKVAGLLAASPGGLGGIRGLTHVRTILAGIGVWVAPSTVSLPAAHEAFDDTGAVANERARARLEKLVGELLHFLR